MPNLPEHAGMNSETTMAAYDRACRRYLEVQAVADVHERIRQILEFQTVGAAVFERLRAEADKSDPAVWFALGDAYSRGWGTKEERGQARRWFQQAADAGHTRSMVRLGNLLKRPPPDGEPTEAVRWFRRAADLGNASGMINMGFAYSGGTGVVCNNQEAVDWFIKAVEAGDIHSMIHVGRMYSRHLQRPDLALSWFLRAAEASQTESHLELAFLYEDRKSSLYDPQKAIHWYLKVAEGSSSSVDRARIALARFCRNGEGTRNDIVEAKAWLNKVIEASTPKSAFHREARTLLKKWESELL